MQLLSPPKMDQLADCDTLPPVEARGFEWVWTCKILSWGQYWSKLVRRRKKKINKNKKYMQTWKCYIRLRKRVPKRENLGMRDRWLRTKELVCISLKCSSSKQSIETSLGGTMVHTSRRVRGKTKFLDFRARIWEAHNLCSVRRKSLIGVHTTWYISRVTAVKLAYVEPLGILCVMLPPIEIGSTGTRNRKVRPPTSWHAVHTPTPFWESVCMCV